MQKELEVQRVLATRAQVQDPALSAYDVFMGNLYVDMRRRVLRVLYMMRRALEYRGVARLPEFDAADEDVASLKATFGRLVEERLLIAENQKGTKQPFVRTDTSPVRVEYTRETHPSLFAELDTTGRFVFDISPESEAFAFLNGWNVTVSEVGVQYDLSSSPESAQAEASISLTHTGRAVLTASTREQVPFSHERRPATIAVPLREGVTPSIPFAGNLRGEPGHFAEVSPFRGSG